MSKAAGPAERDFPAVRVAPITLALAAPEEISLETLHVVTVGVDESYGAARVVEVDCSRVEAFYAGLFGFFSAGHQNRQIATPVGRCLDMPPEGGHFCRLELIATVIAENR